MWRGGGHASRIALSTVGAEAKRRAESPFTSAVSRSSSGPNYTRSVTQDPPQHAPRNGPHFALESKYPSCWRPRLGLSVTRERIGPYPAHCDGTAKAFSRPSCEVPRLARRRNRRSRALKSGPAAGKGVLCQRWQSRRRFAPTRSLNLVDRVWKPATPTGVPVISGTKGRPESNLFPGMDFVRRVASCAKLSDRTS